MRAVTEEELAEIYPVRAAVEELAAREAAARLGGEVGLLEDELAAMRRAADEADLHGLVEHDVRFHRVIVEAAENRILLDVWTSLRVEARTIITALKTGIDHHELANTHGPVLAALAEHNPERAGRAMRRHIEEFGELVLRGGTS